MVAATLADTGLTTEIFRKLVSCLLYTSYVPSDTTVAIDDKVTYSDTDYKVFGIYTAIDGVGDTNHLKLELVKWKAT